MPGIARQAFLFKSFLRPRFDFIWHHHPEFEITLIECGQGVRYVGGSVQPFYEGDLCLLGSNLPHAYGTHPRWRDSCRWKVIHFQPGQWGREFWALPENRPLTRLLEKSARGIHFSGRGASAARDAILALGAVRPGDPARIPLFLQLLGCLSQVEKCELLNPRAQTCKDSVPTDERIGKILAWIESESTKPITLEDGARLLRMSGPAFSRFFHAKTGRTFSRHLNETRIAHACASLATTERSIAEIAFESGYNNLANFNRRFRDIVGMTPKSYRCMIRGG